MRETSLRHIEPLSCEPLYNLFNIFTLAILNARDMIFVVKLCHYTVANNAVNIYMRSLSTN